MSEALVLLALLAAATIRGAAPLVLAALGGLFAERSGVVDIGLEGKMLASAFAAAATAAVTGSAWMGLGAGIAAAVALALVHGLASITYRGNQVVSGMALNILMSGLTVVLGYAWFQQGGQTPLLADSARFAPIVLPGAADPRGHTRPRPRVRRGRERPQRARVRGSGRGPRRGVARLPDALRPPAARGRREPGRRGHCRHLGRRHPLHARSRWAACSAGMSGAYLSIAHHSGFIRDMSAGKGYLALAALIFGQWRPVPTLGACLLFAFADAVQVRLQGTPLPVVGVVPVQLIQAIPYVLTVCLLAGFVGRAVAPRAIGVPYVKER